MFDRQVVAAGQLPISFGPDGAPFLDSTPIEQAVTDIRQQLVSQAQQISSLQRGSRVRGDYNRYDRNRGRGTDRNRLGNGANPQYHYGANRGRGNWQAQHPRNHQRPRGAGDERLAETNKLFGDARGAGGDNEANPSQSPPRRPGLTENF
ncbi:MAG: hypothetical protein FJ267_19920 [Planctomycetes bacterium]|nr:hypothetical protein [Planctomycetota bacterium]